MEYKFGQRRWLLIDETISEDGRNSFRRVIKRCWTGVGATFYHDLIQPFLRPRGGRASILLYDLKTKKEWNLSTQ